MLTGRLRERRQAINAHKTMATVFRKGKGRTTPALEVHGVDVRFRPSMKILGVVCDERLDWNKHAAYVKARV